MRQTPLPSITITNPTWTLALSSSQTAVHGLARTSLTHVTVLSMTTSGANAMLTMKTLTHGRLVLNLMKARPMMRAGKMLNQLLMPAGMSNLAVMALMAVMAVMVVMTAQTSHPSIQPPAETTQAFLLLAPVIITMTTMRGWHAWRAKLGAPIECFSLSTA